MKEGKIAKIDDIYFYALAIKECGIVDFFLPTLKDEVMKIQPVQKQTSAGQRMKFKAFVIVGDMDGHVGLGVKGAKEVATAIRGAIMKAKLSVVPVLRGYWGNKIGLPHTVPCKVPFSPLFCSLSVLMIRTLQFRTRVSEFMAPVLPRRGWVPVNEDDIVS